MKTWRRSGGGTPAVATLVFGEWDEGVLNAFVEWTAPFNPTQWDVQVSLDPEFISGGNVTVVPGDQRSFTFETDENNGPYARVRPRWGDILGDFTAGVLTSI